MPLILRRSRAEVEGLLRERIQRADVLLDQQQQTQGSQFRHELNKWNDYNRDLLESLFEGNGAVAEYRQAGAMTLVDRRTSVRMSQRLLIGRLKGKLESLCERLPLAEEPLAPAAEAVQIEHVRTRPRLFVGSSVEGLKIANAVQTNLDHDAEVVIWAQGVFLPSVGNLANLVAAARECDFAALILTPDDLLQKKSDRTHSSPRDNVVFELGLFMGALGTERVFIVKSREDDLDMPTDLAGVSPLTFAQHSDKKYQASLGAACSQIRTAMEKHGLRARH